jgi:hypothetical protein
MPQDSTIDLAEVHRMQVETGLCLDVCVHGGLVTARTVRPSLGRLHRYTHLLFAQPTPS